MPDILGYYDRRADGPDFNPLSGKIEPGYEAHMKRESQNARKRDKTRIDRIKKFFSNFDLSEQELTDEGYNIFSHEGTIIGGLESGEVGVGEVAILEKGKNTRQVSLVIMYENKFSDDFYLPHIRSALKLKQIIQNKGIPYSEKPSTDIVLTKLKSMSDKIDTDKGIVSGLLKKLS